MSAASSEVRLNFKLNSELLRDEASTRRVARCELDAIPRQNLHFPVHLHLTHFRPFLAHEAKVGEEGEASGEAGIERPDDGTRAEAGDFEEDLRRKVVD